MMLPQSHHSPESNQMFEWQKCLTSFLQVILLQQYGAEMLLPWPETIEVN